MGRILFPLVLCLAGLAAGLATGVALKPAGDTPPIETAAAPPPGVFVNMASNFVVPLIDGQRIRSMLVLTLGLEVAEGEVAAVRAQEPRLRDAFLRVLFDHANAGGFDGVFTAASPMASLRIALRETAREVAGPKVQDVLILDMIRQD